jgi:hypothetical protein
LTNSDDIKRCDLALLFTIILFKIFFSKK